MGVEVRRRGDGVARERQGDGAARSDRWCGERGGERAPCRGTHHGGARGDANEADPSTGNVRGAHIRTTPAKGPREWVRQCCSPRGGRSKENSPGSGGAAGSDGPYAPRARGSGREAGSSTRRSWSASSRSSAPATEVPACTSTTARALSASTPGPCWQQAGEPCGFPPDAQRPRDPDGCMRAATPATVAAHPRCARVPGGGARDGVARRARR
jgi:hypothetical protein